MLVGLLWLMLGKQKFANGRNRRPILNLCTAKLGRPQNGTTWVNILSKDCVNSSLVKFPGYRRFMKIWCNKVVQIQDKSNSHIRLDDLKTNYAFIDHNIFKFEFKSMYKQFIRFE